MNRATDFTDARYSFVQSTEKCKGGQILTHQSPVTGPSGELLSVDVFLYGQADARRKLALVSGVHGVEGFCGSMLQSHLLNNGLAGELPRETSLVLVHAANPYGFAWARRVTEEGIDLNRNFLDFQDPKFENIEFDQELASLLTPPPRNREDVDSRLRGWFAGVGASGREIIASGQNNFPAAPFYSGRQPSWSRNKLEQIVRTHLSSGEKICLIDYHTGLGEFSVGQIIGASNGSRSDYEDARAVWGDKVVLAGSPESVSYQFSGEFIGVVSRISQSQKCAAVAQEFGTIPEMEVLSALRDDHGAYLYGDEYDKTRARTSMMNAFFPSSDDWVSNVEKEAELAIQNALSWLGSSSSQ